MLSALVLAFLGVPDEVIVEDYVLSARAMEGLMARLKEEYPEAPEAIDRYAPAVLHVPAEAMELFLASVRSRARLLPGPGRVAGCGRRRRRALGRAPRSSVIGGPGIAPGPVGRIGGCPASSTRRRSM